MIKALILTAALTLAACSINNSPAGPSQKEVNVAFIIGVEQRQMSLPEGESRTNRLSVCSTPNVALHGEAIAADSLVARSVGVVTFVANDTVTMFCGAQGPQYDGYAATVSFDGLSVGSTKFSVHVWSDPALRSPESFSVDVTKAP